MKKLIYVFSAFIAAALVFPSGGSAQMEPPKMHPGMMPHGMAGAPPVGSGMMPVMERPAHERMGLAETLHQWGCFFSTHRETLGLSEEQIEKIEAIMISHAKYGIRKNADRKVLLIEIKEALLQDKINLEEVEKKLKAMEALHVDMEMEGIKTLDQALAVLTPEQRKMIKNFFKEAAFPRAMKMRMPPKKVQG